MFGFLLPKEIDANSIKTNREARDALILAAKNGIPILNVDYFQNHENYRRFQYAFVSIFLDAKHGRIPRTIGVKLNKMDEKYGLGKLFDAERNEKYFSNLENQKNILN